MIQSKADLKRYLEQDRIALYRKSKRPRIAGDEIWQYEILLRKTEYYMNCHKTAFGKAIAVFYHYRLRKMGRKLCGFHIPPNAFEEGLSIAHWGPIVVHPTARIGKNCRIHQCVTIGATNGENQAARIGDNVFIGPCTSIIGDIYNGPCNLDHGIEKMREHGIMRITKGRSANYVIQNVHVGIQSKGSHRGSPRGEKSK